MNVPSHIDSPNATSTEHPTDIMRTGPLPDSNPSRGKLSTGVNTCDECRARKKRCSREDPKGLESEICQACFTANLDCTSYATDISNPTSSGLPQTPHIDDRTNEASSTTEKHKRTQVRSACMRCRKRKAKCSGDRPSCQSCSQRNEECSYNVAEGFTRAEDNTEKLRAALALNEDLNAFIDALRFNTNAVSSELFARLRCGEPVQDLLTLVRAEVLPTWSAEELHATGIKFERNLLEKFKETD